MDLLVRKSRERTLRTGGSMPVSSASACLAWRVWPGLRATTAAHIHLPAPDLACRVARDVNERRNPQDAALWADLGMYRACLSTLSQSADPSSRLSSSMAPMRNELPQRQADRSGSPRYSNTDIMCPAPISPVCEKSCERPRGAQESAHFVDRQCWAWSSTRPVRARNGELSGVCFCPGFGPACLGLSWGNAVDASAAATIASVVIAVLALAFGFIQYSQRRRQQLLIDLQGDKEAVAAVATRIRNGRMPWRKRNRSELLEAMCLAAVFERSGRSRSLVYAALTKAMAREEYREDIISNVEDISAVITRNSPYTDLARAQRRLFALRAALSMNDDLRIRVQRIDAYLSQPKDAEKFDERCEDEIHRWGAFKKVLEQRKSIVLVCPRLRAGDFRRCPTIALDFHRTARPSTQPAPEGPVPIQPAPEGPVPMQPAPEGPGSAIAHIQLNPLPPSKRETFQLTELGQQVHSAKYDKNIENLNLIADELVKVITNHIAYDKIDVIAVVPGDFSDRLGQEVARKTFKQCVHINRIGPKLELTDSNSVKGKYVILLDDVYRTGDTMRSAAEVLRTRGALQVFGLTATCTVSAIAPHCGHH